MATIIKIRDVDTANLRFKKDTDKKVLIKYWSGKELIPLTILLGKVGYRVDTGWDALSLRVGLDNLPKLSQALEIIDTEVQKVAWDNLEAWFGFTKEQIDSDDAYNNYRPLVSTGKKTGKKEARLGLSNNGITIRTPIFDHMSRPILPQNALQELAFNHKSAQLLVRLDAIWINQETYGSSWHVVQIKLENDTAMLPLGCQILTSLTAVKDHCPDFSKLDQPDTDQMDPVDPIEQTPEEEVTVPVTPSVQTISPQIDPCGLKLPGAIFETKNYLLDTE